MGYILALIVLVALLTFIFWPKKVPKSTFTDIWLEGNRTEPIRPSSYNRPSSRAPRPTSSPTPYRDPTRDTDTATSILMDPFNPLNPISPISIWHTSEPATVTHSYCDSTPSYSPDTTSCDTISSDSSSCGCD